MRVSMFICVVLLAVSGVGRRARGRRQLGRRGRWRPTMLFLRNLLRPSNPSAQVLQPVQDAPTIDSTSGANAVAPEFAGGEVGAGGELCGEPAWPADACERCADGVFV